MNNIGNNNNKRKFNEINNNKFINDDNFDDNDDDYNDDDYNDINNNKKKIIEVDDIKTEENTTEKSVSWTRSKITKPIKPSETGFCFQGVDIDMYDGDPLKKNPDPSKSVPGSSVGPVPILRIFGVSQLGFSVCAHVHGFTPYFYCDVPVSNFKDSDCGKFRQELENKMRNTQRKIAYRNLKTYVHAVIPEYKQSLMGYHFGRKKKVLKIMVALPGLVPSARNILQREFQCPGYPIRSYTTYESNVPFTLRYMVDNDIVGGGWLELKKNTYSFRKRFSSECTTRCQLEIDVVYSSIISRKPTIDRWSRIAPLRILSFDIECLGRAGHFPDPNEDPVIQIASTLTVHGGKEGDENTTIVPKTDENDDSEVVDLLPTKDAPSRKNVLVLGTCLAIAGAEVKTFSNEKDLLLEFSKLIRKSDPDVITGYNIQNFDIPYIMNRAGKLKILNQFAHLGRILYKESKMKKSTFSSSAYGTRESTETTIHGRIMMDVLQYMYRNQKLSSYSLNAVSAEFLGQQKEDVHHSIIGDLHKGTDEDRRRLAVYCLKDAVLPQLLMDKLLILINYVEMARVTGVPIPFLFSRGQQIKVLSMLYRKARQHDLIIPVVHRQNNNNSKNGVSSGGNVAYEGATVLEPKTSFYQIPIATLDFASLYPSIMQAHNLCYTTLLAPEDVSKVDEKDREQSPHGNYFVRASKQKGLLPTILDELLKARKLAKKDMKNAKDPLLKAVMNGRQLALKISANSVYGFTGAVNGALPCIPISSSVTSYGRDMIDETKNAVEQHYTKANGYPGDAEVVYGDSVTGDTPLLIRRNGIVDIVNIEDLTVFEVENTEKQYSIPKDLIESWTETGWTKVENIMRHKLAPNKKIIRVVTHTGTVDVTEDHSLILEDGNEIQPTKLSIGDKLLQSFPENLVFRKFNISNEEAQIFGMFWGDGDATISYSEKYSFKYTTAINNKNFELLKIYQNLWKNVGIESKILNTIDSSGVYKLVPVGDLKTITTKYRTFFYDQKTKHKIIPPSILFNEDESVRLSFLQGAFDSDGDKEKQISNSKSIKKTFEDCLKSGKIDQKGKINCAQLTYLLKSVGFNISVNTRLDKPSIFIINFTKAKLRKKENEIKNIYVLKTNVDQYVYDLTTKNHHFQAGIGNIIVHNTDSVMIKFGSQTVEESMKLGYEAAEKVTKIFPQPVALEFEKVYYPYLLMNKKRYAGLFWTKPDKWDKLDTKGIETVRRDNCKLVRTLIGSCLRKILINRNVNSAIEEVKQTIERLLLGKVDISLLIITKSLSGLADKYAAKQAHVELAERMRKRDPGSAPVVGDRVPFVIIQVGGKNQPAYLKSEDPIYVLENGLPIDTEYYLKQQLAKPLIRLFKPIIPNPEETLLSGSHTRKIKKATPSSNVGLMKFAVKRFTCLSCKNPLPKGDKSALCKNCIPKKSQVYLNELVKSNKFEKKFNDYWVTCQRCMGSLTADILCSNSDCEIFYMRKKVQKDLKTAQENLKRFEF